jgi:hypothetical protein
LPLLSTPGQFSIHEVSDPYRGRSRACESRVGQGGADCPTGGQVCQDPYRLGGENGAGPIRLSSTVHPLRSSSGHFDPSRSQCSQPGNRR